MSDLPTTSFAVLGLIASGPISRYELWQQAERSIANFWTIAKSQVYGELERLEKLGYVSGADVRQKGKPDKKTYRITPEGTAALRTWLAEPAQEQDRIRSTLLVKLFFGNLMPDTALRDHLDQYRAKAEARRAQLEPVVQMLTGMKNAEHMRACALLGLRINEAMVSWADEVTKDLFAVRSRKKGR